MKTMVIFSEGFYFVVLAVCVYAIVIVFVSIRKGMAWSEMWLPAFLIASLCGILVSVVYVFENRTLSGLYVMHQSFAMSPLFLRSVSGGGGKGVVIPLVMSVVVVATVIISFFGGVPWNVDRWIPLIMTVVLVVLIGMNMWRLTEGLVKPDAVVAVKDWTVSFVDVLYYAVLVLVASIGSALGHGTSWSVAIGSCICVLFLIGLLVATWLRLRAGSAFLFLHSREETYLRSIRRSSRISYAGNGECGLSSEELYERLKEYFDEKMPYLKPKLKMTDVARNLLTNKVYISRVINEFTGQNFSQFVNSYRIMYATKLFKGNNAYRIADLAFKSGFNSEKTFVMAFRLYMNISPSRWCKQNMGNPDVQILQN